MRLNHRPDIETAVQAHFMDYQRSLLQSDLMSYGLEILVSAQFALLKHNVCARVPLC